MKRYLWLLLVAVSMPVGFVTFPQWIENNRESSLLLQSRSYQIPFDYYQDHIYIPVSINGTQPHWFILDSGAPNIFISQDYDKILKLQPEGVVEIGGIGPKRHHGTLSKAIDLNIAGVNWSNQDAIVAPPEFFSPLEGYFGRKFSGVMGYEFFEKFVVEIDYENQIIHLHNPKTYHYSGSGTKVPLKISGHKPYLQTTLTLTPGLSVESKLLIDLGRGAGLDLRGKFLDKYPEILSKENTLASFTLGVGGEGKVHMGRVETLQLGELNLQDIVTVFSLGKGQKRPWIAGRIGNKTLQRFKVILDYPNQQMILEPNDRFSEPYEYDMSGLWLEAEGQNYKRLRIDKVFANSPGSKAGFQVGDIITHVDGKLASELTLAQIRQLLKSQEGQIRWLTIQREDESLELSIQLQRQI